MRERYVIIPAGGTGSRMGGNIPKQMLELDGVPVLRRTLDLFLDLPFEVHVIISINAAVKSMWVDYCRKEGLMLKYVLVPGGMTRFHSVRKTMKYLPDGALVAVHDAVRPLLRKEDIIRMYEEGEQYPAVVPVLPVTNDFFLAAVFGGIITGAGVGIVIRNGASFDGTEIVAIITDRKTVFSVGEIVMFINLFILSSASFVFGWDKAMYSLVAYFVISKMIDVVIKGLEETYAVMIVTSQHDEITDKLMKQMDKGVTLLHGEGGYSKEKRKILYCIVTRLEIDSLKSIVLDIDEAAFITINPVSDIVGGRLRRKKRH